MNKSNEEVGKVMLDLSSKTKHLNCLNSKVDQIKKEILSMYRVLDGEETGYLADGVFYTGDRMYQKGEINWPTLEDISNLLEDINTTKEIIDRLEQQKNEFGLA